MLIRSKLHEQISTVKEQNYKNLSKIKTTRTNIMTAKIWLVHYDMASYTLIF